MEEHDLSALGCTVHAFRDAIEQCKGRLVSIALQEFPRGSCGDVSGMLGIYLQHKGHENVLYVSGKRGSVQEGTSSTHAWLEVDGVTVDITADQFEDAPRSVIVASGSAWHATFDIDCRRSPGSSHPPEEFKIKLDEDFNTIVNQVYFIC